MTIVKEEEAASSKKEELQEARAGIENSEFFKRILGDAPKNDVDGDNKDAKEEEGAGDEEEKAGEEPELPPVPVKSAPKPKKPAKKAPKKEDDEEEDGEEEKEREEPQKEPDYEKIAEAAGRGVAKVLDSRKPQPAKKTGGDIFDELPEEFRKKAEIYRQLVKLDPKKYQADKLVGDIKGFQAKESKYREEWEKEHEGERFDASSEEHEEFYSRNSPEVDTDDLEQAKLAVVRDEVKREVRQELDEKFKAVDKQKKVGEVIQRADMAYAGMLTGVVKEVAGEETPDITPQGLDKLAEKNPVVADAMMEVLPNYRRQIHVAYAVLNGAVDYDEKNPEHRLLADKIGEIEAELETKPAAETAYTVNGKRLRYVNTTTYQEMTPAQKAECWTLDPNYIGRWLAAEAKEKVREKQAELERKNDAYAKARGYARGASQGGGKFVANGSSQGSGAQERAPLLRNRTERGEPTIAREKKGAEVPEGIARFLKNVGLD